MPVEREVIRARTCLQKFVTATDDILSKIRRKKYRDAALRLLDLKSRAEGNIERLDKLIRKQELADQKAGLSHQFTTTPLDDEEIE